MLEKFKGEKTKQRVAIGIAIAVGIGAFWLISNLMSGGDNKQKKVEEEKPQVEVVNKETEQEPFKKIYGEKLMALENQIEDMKKQMQTTQEILKEIKNIKQTNMYNITGKPFGLPNPKVIITGKQEASTPNAENPSNSVVFNDNTQTTQTQPPPVKITLLNDAIALNGNPQAQEEANVSQNKTEEKEKKEKENVKDTIPAGSFARAVLLSGLDAPTNGSAVRNPFPVLLKLTDKAILPNKWKSNIRNCFVIGSSYGDLSSERAYIRLERLSCVKNNGEIISKAVEGYVSGEDGKAGLKGRVVSKQGQLLARTIMAGFLDGLAQAFSYTQQTVLISPQGAVQTVKPSQALEYAGLSGVSQAAKKLADFYMNLVNQTFPVVEILPGRKVDVVFLKDVKLGE